VGIIRKLISHSYILNRGWIDRSSGRVPTYKEVVSTSAVSNEDEKSDDDQAPAGDEEDEDFEDVVDHFESSYNFRFEEP
jgi:protein KRI1